MNPIHYRKARIEDAAQIVRFQIAMALETEGLRLDPPTCEKGVAAVFQDPARGQYHVAERDGQVIGSLLIIPEWSDWRNGTVWWIHSLYVEPAHRGQGVFSAFYRHIRGIVEGDPALRGLRLYVDKRNTSARRIYRSLGMSDEHYDVFEWMKPTP